MSTQIQLRRDTAANWTSTNPVLAQAEAGYETDTGKLKLGDGTTAWNSLAYQAAANIADGTIVDADVNASAAIAGTKIEQGSTSVRGTVQLTDSTSSTSTTTAATPASVKAAYDLADLAGAVAVDALPKAGGTMTGALVHPLGAAATPSITFTGDLNTGIFSPGADQVAVATNGGERLRITSAGLVGIGTSSPNAVVHLSKSGTSEFTTIRLSNTGASGRTYEIGLGGNTTAADFSNKLYFYDSTAAITRMVIDSSGRVGIGTTSPGTPLTVQGNTNAESIRLLGRSSDDRADLQFYENDASTLIAGLSAETNTVNLFLSSGSGELRITGNQTLFRSETGTERARIDSSGRLLVGTASARSNFFNTTNTARLQIEGTTNETSSISITRNSADTGGPFLLLGKSRSGSVVGTTVVNSGDLVGAISFQAADGTELVEAARISTFVDATPGANDMPGRLVFSTTADGADSPTERMRISNAGAIFFPSVGTTASAANAFLNSGSSPANQLLRSTSSLRYKTDIENIEEDRSAAIIDFRPVWYRSTAEADRNDWSWYGLIAEEVAEIEPRLVHWTYLDDAYEEIDGEKQLKPDAEMVPDGVQYDRLTVLLLDVVKRQQQAIETLEAKVAALEAL